MIRVAWEVLSAEIPNKRGFPRCPLVPAWYPSAPFNLARNWHTGESVNRRAAGILGTTDRLTATMFMGIEGLQPVPVGMGRTEVRSGSGALGRTPGTALSGTRPRHRATVAPVPARQCSWADGASGLGAAHHVVLVGLGGVRGSRAEYRRWERSGSMELWQMDIVGGVMTADPGTGELTYTSSGVILFCKLERALQSDCQRGAGEPRGKISRPSIAATFGRERGRPMTSSVHRPRAASADPENRRTSCRPPG